MKVPYLAKKIKNEQQVFIRELTTALATSIRRQRRTNVGDECFKNLYPLFNLLRSFRESPFQTDPSREYALMWLKQVGDRDGFLNALIERGRNPRLSAAVKEGVREATFSEFFAEIFSDCLLMLVNSVSFNYRGAMIAMRCALEDLYRHLYYKDHPEELRLIRSGDSEDSMSPAKLREYLKRVSYLEVFHQVDETFKRKPARPPTGTVPTNDLFSNNDRLYAETSLAVHGALGTWLSGFETPASLSFDALKQTKLENYISGFSEIAIAFLVAAHFDRFTALDDYTKSIVLSRLSAPKRQKFRELLNV